MLSKAQKYAEKHGYATLQDFIRELLREKVFGEEIIGGLHTYRASEQALAKNWLAKEEDEAWVHLQEET